MSRISGPTLLGFGDYFVGGTEKPKNTKAQTDFVLNKSAKGRVYTSFAPTKGQTHEQSVQKAKETAKVATATAATVVKALHGGVTKIKGLVETAPKKVLAKTAQTAAQLGQQANALVQKAQQLGQQADKNAAILKQAKAKVQGAAKAQKAYGPSGKPGTRVVVGGVSFFEQQGGRYEIGEDPDATVPDSTAPDDAPPPTGGPPTKAPALIPGQDYMPDPHPDGKDEQVYHGLPVGAIVYDPKMKPLPWAGLGSYTRFGGDGNPQGGNGSGFQWGGGHSDYMDGWYWYWASAFSGTEYKHENAGNSIREAGDYGRGQETMKRRAEVSVQLGWGPLIGNPSLWTKGLRYDVDGDKWFWFYDTAPDWARASDPINGDFVRHQKTILDYQTALTAAKADALRKAAQDKLDKDQADALAKQHAKEDAEHARQKLLEDERQAAAQQERERQQQERERQQQADKAKQALADRAAKTQRLSERSSVTTQKKLAKAQAAQAEARAQMALAKYAEQNPEEAFGPGAGQGPGDQGPDDQGDPGDDSQDQGMDQDEGAMDDPSGDMTEDTSGEDFQDDGGGE